MNKLTKGAIATAAGIALLMGGAGTFALWNDSVGVNGGTVQTGTLDIDTTGTGTWKDVSSTVVGGTTQFDFAATAAGTYRVAVTVSARTEGRAAGGMADCLSAWMRAEAEGRPALALRRGAGAADTAALDAEFASLGRANA